MDVHLRMLRWRKDTDGEAGRNGSALSLHAKRRAPNIALLSCARSRPNVTREILSAKGLSLVLGK